MGSQEILKQYNALKNQYDAVNYDSILKAQLEKDASNKKADIDTFSSGYDSQINNTQAVYDKKIAEEKLAYDSEYQKNAVQKLINEKKIAEINANLGLTDSGLNRTQQTAAQLSYANQKGKIDLARQSALENLTLAMTDAITTLQNQKASGIRDIENNWKSYSENQAQNTYNAQLNSIAGQLSDMGDQYFDAVKAEANAAAEVQKAAIAEKENENNKILWYYTGTYDEYDNPIFRNSEGKTQAFGKGVNPYTGTKHKDTKYGTFSNGYQPNHISITTVDEKGKKIVAPKKLYSQPEYEVYVNGKKQQVWSYDNGETLWAWDGSINDYVDVTSQRDDLKKNGGN